MSLKNAKNTPDEKIKSPKVNQKYTYLSNILGTETK